MRRIKNIHKDDFLYPKILALVADNEIFYLFRIGNTDDFLFCYRDNYDSYYDAISDCLNEMIELAFYVDSKPQLIIPVLPGSRLLTSLLSELTSASSSPSS